MGGKALAKVGLGALALAWTSAGLSGAAVVSNTTVRTVPGNCTALATSLADPILFPIGTVPAGIDIADVDVSVLYSHPDRNAAYVALIQPITNGGYRRIALKTNTGPNVANLNATFDDEAAQAVNIGSHADADPLTPVFNDRVRPSAALSTADGISDANDPNTPAGQGRTWFLEVCNTSATAGQLRRVDIDYAVAADVADLSLEILTSGSPLVGQPFTATVRVSNAAGGAAATGVAIEAAFGTGFTVTNVSGATANGNGDYVIGGSIAAGASRDVVFTLDPLATGDATIFSEVVATSRRDPDSGPRNRIVGEDDTDSADFNTTTTPANQPPTLQCALGRPVNTLAWQSYVVGNNLPRDWPPASNTEGYTIPSPNDPDDIPVSVTFTGNTNRFVTRNLGTNRTLQTPVSDGQFTGGGIFGNGVIMSVDFAAYTESVTLTFDYGTTAIGAGGIQIPIADVDRGSWTDRIVASATLGNTSVTPIYTPGSNNIVEVRNGVRGLTGTGGSGNTQGLGNSWITFPGSVDTVTLTYSNVAAATGDPTQQVISIEDLIFCDPENPRLTAQKVVETDGYYLPGETVTYRLQATSAPGANVGAESVTLDDTLPGNLRFVSAAVSGLGSSGTFDPALPAAQTDCAGNGNTACRIRYVGGELAREQTGEVTITAVVK